MILNTGRRSSTQKHNPRRIIQVSLHSLTHYHLFPFYSFILFVIYFLSCSSPTFLLITYFVPILFVSKLLSPPTPFNFLFPIYLLTSSCLFSSNADYFLFITCLYFLYFLVYLLLSSNSQFHVLFCLFLLFINPPTYVEIKKKIILTPSNNIQS